MPPPRHPRTATPFRCRTAAFGLTLALGFSCSPAAATSAPPAKDADAETGRTRDSGLVEKTASRLVQFDVTVNGPAEAVRSLTAADFKIKLDLGRLEAFEIDRFCADPAPLARPGRWSAEQTALPPAAPRSRQASYVFYFDQPHLTAGGRRRAIAYARGLIPQLVRDGHRGMVVSNASELATLAHFTGDATELVDAVDRMEVDRRHWDLFSVEEGSRVADVMRVLNRDGNVDLAIAMARTHQREERRRTDKSLRRLEAVLARLAEVEAPKAVVYFADTMRSNAGEHYLSFFGGRLLEGDAELVRMASDGLSSNLAYDRVVDQATTQGVRLYTIQAEGLVSHVDAAALTSRAAGLTGQGGYTSRVRVGDAQDTLVSLARESGGHAFLNGAPAARVVEQVRRDFSCLYLISFDPAPFTADRPYRLKVQLSRPGIEVRTRGRIVLQSEAARMDSRLLAAFTAPEAVAQELMVKGNLVPTGYRDGRYSALAQVTVPGTLLSGTTWDLGTSLVSGNRVRAEASGRLSISGPGIRVTLEREVRFPPGDYEIVSVAHETTTDMLASGQSEGRWPDPDRGEAFLGPIVLLQPETGAFLRGETVRESGSLARQRDEPIRRDRPLAFVGLVCRGRFKKHALAVERSLLAGSPVEFAGIDLEETGDACAQFRDVIPAGTLGAGSYEYRARVIREGQVVARAERTFFVVESDP